MSINLLYVIKNNLGCNTWTELALMPCQKINWISLRCSNSLPASNLLHNNTIKLSAMIRYYINVSWLFRYEKNTSKTSLFVYVHCIFSILSDVQNCNLMLISYVPNFTTLLVWGLVRITKKTEAKCSFTRQLVLTAMKCNL
jgi:hypothetical protein